MDTETARSKEFLFERIGGQPYVNNKVCKYWLAGTCNRNPCRFLHSQMQPAQYQRGSNCNLYPNPYCKKTWMNPDYAKNSSNQGVNFEPKRSVTVSSRCKVPDYVDNSSSQVAVNSRFEDSDHTNNASKQVAVRSECKRNMAVNSNFQELEVIKEILTETPESGKNIHKAQPKLCKVPDYVDNSSSQVAVISRFEDSDHTNNASKQVAVRSECKRNMAVNSNFQELEVSKEIFTETPESGKNIHKAQPKLCKVPDYVDNSSSQVAVNSNFQELEVNKEIFTETPESGKNIHKAQPKLCEYWAAGNCVHGDKCEDLHSWFCGSGFSVLAKLEGHKKAVTGITLPSGFDKLLSGSKDESVQLWDCHSGQCVRTVKVGSDVGCLISEGPWVFVGLQNSVKAWNFKTQSELVLDGPCGLVCALAVEDDVLFAGVQDGSILAWKCNFGVNHIELAETLKGHSLSVISLVIGRKRLYSGSKDETIRVWDVKTLQCLHSLSGHTNFVTALLCWDNYLLSGALDNTIKVWAATESGNLELVYEVKEEYGILALAGMKDPEGKPILFCSCKDNAVRLYELPTFSERGRIFWKTEIWTLEMGFDGLFFIGDATGELIVWKMH